MNGRSINRNSIPANRLVRDDLKGLLTELLAELAIAPGGGGPASGSGPGTSEPATFTLNNVSSGLVLNHALGTLTPTCVATLPGGGVAAGVSVQPALAENGQPDPDFSVLICPANWSGTITLSA